MLVAARNRLDAELARSVAAADVTGAPEQHDGIKTMQSWLRGHCRLSGAEADRVVQRGRALEQLPAVAAGFADGLITAEQVTVAAQVTRPDHITAAATQQVDLPQIDGALAQVAMTRPHADLGKVVAHYLACLAPDGPEPDPTEGRRLSIATWSDGTVTGSFSSMPSAGRSSRPPWNPSCRPTGPRAMTGPAPSSWPMPSSSWSTTSSPPAPSRSCAAANRTCCSPSAPPTCSTPPSSTDWAGSGSAPGSPPPRPGTPAATPTSPRCC